MSAKIKILSAEKYISLVKQKLPSLVTLDCTWYPSGKDGYQEYKTEHIAGARYFPITEVKSESRFPHMMPRNFWEFASGVSKLGLHQTDYLVVYDQTSFLSAPRAAWLFTTFGHKDVYLLDNYQQYKKLGGALESGDGPALEESDYLPEAEDKPSATKGTWLNYEDVVKLVKSGDVPKKYNLIDARGAGRFSGAEAEPRPGISSGHIPGSKNLPFTDVVDNEGHFKTKAELTKIFEKQGIDPTKHSIVLCGSGVTACVVKAGIDNAFDTSADIYDGSWSEWGQRAPEDLVEKS